MEKFINRTADIVLGAFTALFLWVTANGLLAYDAVSYFYHPVLIALGIAAYIPLILILRRYMIPRFAGIRALPPVLLVLFACISIAVGVILRVNPSWDMGEVFSIAKALANGQVVETYYLYYFPNNLMVTLIYTIVFKLALLFGAADFVLVATVFNALVVAGTAVFLYLTARALYGKELSLLLLVITLFTTPLYLQAAIYYTDSLSMFFVSAMLYFAIGAARAGKRGVSVAFQILFGGVTFVAFETKITSFILIIALFLYAVYRGFTRKDVRKFALAALTFVLLFAVFTVAKKQVLDKELLDRYQYPPEHWVMMGLNGVGGFSIEDCAYTSSFPTYRERQEAAREMIRTRLGWYDGNDFLKHLTAKLKFAFTDGAYFAPEKLRREPVREGILHEFVLTEGKYNAAYKYFPQVMHFGMLIFMIYSAYTMAKNGKKKGIEAAFVLAVFGIALFLLLWENRSRYILTMLPVMMLLQLSGVEAFARRRKERKQNHA